jgi:hypothetical protein
MTQLGNFVKTKRLGIFTRGKEKTFRSQQGLSFAGEFSIIGLFIELKKLISGFSKMGPHKKSFWNFVSKKILACPALREEHFALFRPSVRFLGELNFLKNQLSILDQGHCS